jgi:hypothetical protein
MGDYQSDRDVDGADLAAYLSDPAGVTLEEFSANFGRADCR